MVTKKDIQQELARLGVKKGDIVMLHSAYGAIGGVQGGPEAVIEGFLAAVGSKGTLAVPVFGALGIITEIMRKRPNAVISSAPVGTIAAVGAQAEKLCRDHWKCDTAHGRGTPFAKLAEMKGKICLLGVDQDRNTFLHGIEARLELAYLQPVTQSFKNPAGKTVTRTYKYYPGPHRNFIGLDPVFRDAGVMQTGAVGNAQVRVMDAAGVLKIAMTLGEADPAFVLCDNPACADCRKQHAALARAEIAGEKFTLAASSRLAGRYVPEIIENLSDAGIDKLELDILQGIPAGDWDARRLARAAEEFREAGVTLTAIRCSACPDEPEKLLEKLSAAQIGSVILPLSSENAVIRFFVKHNIRVLLVNTCETAKQVWTRLEKLSAAKIAFGYCFNPVNIRLAGNRAFGTYRPARILKYLAQFDASDVLRDGTPALPAQGEAEFKELLSILRCAGFSGTVTLGGGALPAGDVLESAALFRDLLANC